MSFAKSKLFCFALIAFLLVPHDIYAEAVYHGESESCGMQKRIALTFDDGPHYKYTEEILDILDEYEVKATFFTVGENAKHFPELIDREIASGHEVANHTYSHKNISSLNDSQITEEIKKCEEILGEHEGYIPSLFRPVEGYATKEDCRVIEDLGYDVILWSVDTRDWAHNSVNNIVNNVINNSNDGSIVLFHDFVSGQSPTPEALRKLLPELKKQGYSFVTVSELIENE